MSDDREPRPSEPMLSIGAISRATGIPVETIRTWERRYGYPRAERRPSGHRLYPLAAVARLRRVAMALAAGHRPAEVLVLGEREMDALLLGAGGGTPGAGTEAPRSRGRRDRASRALPSRSEMLAWVTALDGPRLRHAMEAAASLQPPMEFLEETLAPLMEDIGQGWAEGRIEVRHEHFATACASGVLADLRRHHEHPRAAAHVAMSLLPGDRHELGLMMASVVFARAGWRVVYLGADTPVAQLVALARDANPEAMAIGLSSTAPAAALRDLAKLARALPPATRLVVGGSGRADHIPGVLRFPSLEALSRWATPLGSAARKPRRGPRA